MLCNLRVIQQLGLYRSFLPSALGRTRTSGARAYSRPSSTPRASDEPISNEPLKYFGSKAAAWRASETRSGGHDRHLWYQPYVISGSLAVFLLYFCVLREESDIDQRLEGNLFEQVSGLEEVQLTVTYRYNKENGLDTKDIEKRLTELGIDVKQMEQRRLEERLN